MNDNILVERQSWKSLLLQFALVVFLLWHPLFQISFPMPGPGPSSSAGGTPCTKRSGYIHCRAITIAGGQTGGSTLVNFPVATQTSTGTYILLGSSVNSTCTNVAFTTDSGGTTLTPWEIEDCPNNGTVLVHFLAPSVPSAGTTFYVSYGGTTTGENTGSYAPANVWDSSFGPVYHFKGSLGLTDSTGGTTAVNSGASAGAGELDGGASFTPGTSENISGHQWSAYSAFTVSYWVQFATVAGYQFMAVQQSDSSYQCFLVMLYNTSLLRTALNTTSSGFVAVYGTTTLTAGPWYHVAVVYDGTNATTYLNGVQESLVGAGGTVVFASSNKERLGADPTVGSIGDFSGILDEYKVLQHGSIIGMDHGRVPEPKAFEHFS
jgi:hypothetical protein